MDKNAMAELKVKEPLLGRVFNSIGLLRTIGVFHSTFVKAPLDPDGRMRCSYGIAGTVTHRLNSRENAFGTGTNLQNIPRNTGDDDTELTAEVDGEEIDFSSFKLPSIRKMFIPDEGHEIADADLAGADAQVVAWEANDPILKQMFREGKKIHAENAKVLYGRNSGPDGKREPYYSLTKRGVHATNYVCKAPTLAKHLGCTVHEAHKFQRRWFEAHPWIEQWHKRIELQLQTKRYVENKFGYGRHFFGRVDQLLPEAVAWIPQSTIAIVANIAMVNLEEQLPEVEVLLQVHDSLVFQYLRHLRNALLPRAKHLMTITIPYDDPLIIPWGLKVSTVSWGHCQDLKWPEPVLTAQAV
jgi:DNA polymerase-1